MPVFDRIAAMRRRERALTEALPRATCLRCRREYTVEPEDVREDDYCWWCATQLGARSALE